MARSPILSLELQSLGTRPPKPGTTLSKQGGRHKSRGEEEGPGARWPRPGLPAAFPGHGGLPGPTWALAPGHWHLGTGQNLLPAATWHLGTLLQAGAGQVSFWGEFPEP